MVEVEPTSPRIPKNLGEIVESYLITLSRKDRTPMEYETPYQEMDALNKHIRTLSRWIRENTGLKPDMVEQARFDRGDMYCPELVYRQQLPKTKILLERITSEGKTRTYSIKGKNTLEIKIELFS